jgi:hypothetical protein
MSREGDEYSGSIARDTSDDEIYRDEEDIEEDRYPGDLCHGSTSTRVYMWEYIADQHIVEDIPDSERDECDEYEEKGRGTTLEREFADSKVGEQEYYDAGDDSGDHRREECHEYSYTVILRWTEDFFESEVIDIFAYDRHRRR